MSNNPNFSTNLPGHAIWLNLTNQAAQGDSESEVYSDSEDGGMQLDPPEPMVGHYSIDHDALFESPRSPIETRDESQFTTQAPHPDSYLQTGTDHSPMQAAMHPAQKSQSAQKAIPPRPRMSEEEYAALTVLNDEELLTIYALKSGQTIPQTRRRFQAKLLSGGDPQVEEEMFAARFAVPAAKAHLVPGLSRVGSGPGAPETALDLNNAQAFLVPGSWKEVVDHDESGWWAPGQRKRGDGGAKRKASSRAGSAEDSRMVSRSVSRN